MNDSTRSVKRTFSSLTQRHIASLVLALIASTAMIPGMTTYLPLTASDQVAVPILLFPFIWTGLFVYAYMADKAWHATVLMLILTISHGLMAYFAVT
ncbi:hypothetical protein K0504_06140 [Neiella marina]|uniref:Uncharacterized protein n=1 Tax=Neiella holothuriorum TaxID=2870530 RepID=A0ABS7EFZ3_9GAMM|nr:hypothetical protein [Neiella holothuriorum]MBW8190612.1 hypothetical protein [Neiella holothuriorum]